MQFLRVITRQESFFSSWSDSYNVDVRDQQSLHRDVTHHERRVAILVNNPLSYYWKGRITGILPLYISGIVGYAFSVVVRVCELVKYIFDLIMDPFIDDRSYSIVFKEKFISLMGGVVSLGSALVGLVMPPLAYKIDEWIQSYYSVYSNHATKWMTVPKGIVDGSLEEFIELWGNENLSNREARLKQLAKALYTAYFIEAINLFKITQDELSDPEMMPNLRKLTMLLCISRTEHGNNILTALFRKAIFLNRQKVFITENINQLLARPPSPAEMLKQLEQAPMIDSSAGIRSIINGYLEDQSPLLSTEIPEETLTELTQLDGTLSSVERQLDTRCFQLANEIINAQKKESWGRFLLRPFWFV